ncbi:hypothetical protein CDAR_49531 [Caerostris darwini]|uniref:Uncharacterized protein n=1 Tax=Caerostris darwini TaxID=1538125 RepID=A0AAV4PCK6_9ARAC|nr:hypothetical protein CDAR_49531 [Caerostris darwini]
MSITEKEHDSKQLTNFPPPPPHLSLEGSGAAKRSPFLFLMELLSQKASLYSWLPARNRNKATVIHHNKATVMESHFLLHAAPSTSSDRRRSRNRSSKYEIKDNSLQCKWNTNVSGSKTLQGWFVAARVVG